MKSQTISPSGRKAAIEAAAAEALGGPAVKPPAMATRKIARPNVAEDAEKDRAAREAFTLANGGEVGPSKVPTLGNTTFDGVPDEMASRRAKVAAARQGLAKLAAAILKADEMITPILDDLADDAEGLKKAEAFDCEVARGFLGGLKSVVDSITGGKAKPETAAPAEETATEE